MKRPQSGYTIIEVMIFLLVSTALLGSVITMISGRQERVRFTQSVENVERRLQDILNDVSTGYYPTTGNFSCQGNSTTGLTFGTTHIEQGANRDCVFLGKAIWFGSSGSTSYGAYTMVGLRNAANLTQANARLLGAGGNPGIVDNYSILADAEVKKTVSLSDPSRNLTGVALVSEFSQTSALTNEVSGNAARVSLYEVEGNFPANAGNPGMQLASDGVMLCLQQGGVFGRKAAIKIGADGGRQLGTEVLIDQWPEGCPT
jgi:type II secretory pathway pseudopilin PulG